MNKKTITLFYDHKINKAMTTNIVLDTWMRNKNNYLTDNRIEKGECPLIFIKGLNCHIHTFQVDVLTPQTKLVRHRPF